MENLKIFNTPNDIRTYVENNKVKLIGSGAEGYSYLDKDGNTLKYYREYYQLPYDDEILTIKDIDLNYIILPSELYLSNNLIYAYKTKYFDNDVLCNINKKEPSIIDLDNLLRARYNLLSDIEKLTDLRYGLDDVYGNVLFDGKELAIIDTLSYLKDDSSFEDNVKKLDGALDIKLYKIDNKTGEWNMPFEDKVKLLIKENKTSKIVVKPFGLGE